VLIRTPIVIFFSVLCQEGVVWGGSAKCVSGQPHFAGKSREVERRHLCVGVRDVLHPLLQPFPNLYALFFLPTTLNPQPLFICLFLWGAKVKLFPLGSSVKNLRSTGFSRSLMQLIEFSSAWLSWFFSLNLLINAGSYPALERKKNGTHANKYRPYIYNRSAFCSAIVQTKKTCCLLLCGVSSKPQSMPLPVRPRPPPIWHWQPNSGIEWKFS